jgi:hypothetical protein
VMRIFLPPTACVYAYHTLFESLAGIRFALPVPNLYLHIPGLLRLRG